MVSSFAETECKDVWYAGVTTAAVALCTTQVNSSTAVVTDRVAAGPAARGVCGSFRLPIHLCEVNHPAATFRSSFLGAVSESCAVVGRSRKLVPKFILKRDNMKDTIFPHERGASNLLFNVVADGL